MEFFELETERVNLHRKLAQTISVRKRIFFIASFFDAVYLSDDRRLAESYITEFSELFFSSLERYEPDGSSPEFVSLIINSAQLALSYLEGQDNCHHFRAVVGKAQSRSERMMKILTGESVSAADRSKLSFPLLENINNGIESVIGALEYVTVSLSKARAEDELIIVPGEMESDNDLRAQINVAFELAKKFISEKGIGTQKHHRVIISFDKKHGNYRGASLGTVLYLAFVEELLKYYNAPVTVINKNRVAFTGALNSSGSILPVGAESIKDKVNACFYSGINLFVVPKDDEIAAREQLTELREKYPARSFTVTGAEHISDLLNRRDIVEISKINLVVRLGRAINRNRQQAAFILILIAIVSFYLLRDFDTNPAILSAEADRILVKNAEGKVLWERLNVLIKTAGNSLSKIIDVDDDGINEVLLVNDSQQYNEDPDALVCLDSKGNTRWVISFKDTVSSPKEKLPPVYGIRLIDTVTINNRKLLIAGGGNLTSYASVIFKVDLRTGKVERERFWHVGHIVANIIGDFDQDGKKELVFAGGNNDYEMGVIGVVDIDKLSGICPSTEWRRLYGQKEAVLKKYFLIPKTDYQKYYNDTRINIIGNVHLSVDDKITFDIIQGYSFTNVPYSISAKLSKDYNDIGFLVTDIYQVKRDSLVKAGRLQAPYTDTKEYIEILEKSVLYWDGTQFKQNSR